MTTDEAWDHLAKQYVLPRAVLEAQIGRLRREDGTLASDLALVDFLRERALGYERGMGMYGHPVDRQILSEVALLRQAANRLEQLTKEENPDWDKPVACA